MDDFISETLIQQIRVRVKRVTSLRETRLSSGAELDKHSSSPVLAFHLKSEQNYVSVLRL